MFQCLAIGRFNIANVASDGFHKLILAPCAAFGQQQLGRTPRQQLICLGMRRAADLLAEREAKVETIAARVGYRNPFVFSTTFKRVMGWPPSEYPGRG